MEQNPTWSSTHFIPSLYSYTRGLTGGGGFKEGIYYIENIRAVFEKILKI